MNRMILNMQDLIREAVLVKLQESGFDILAEQLIYCEGCKLQKTGFEDECIWSSLENSNEEIIKYDDALSAIVEKLIDGKEIISFSNLTEFCEFYLNEGREDSDEYDENDGFSRD